MDKKEGYPRLLGETIGSKSLTIANYPITVPDYFDNYVFKYGGSFDNLNLVLQNAIDKAEDSNFISNYCLDYTFEDFWESKLNEIIKVEVTIKLVLFSKNLEIYKEFIES